ncbi:MAG: class I SAM-dependent methyltransferase [Tistlia sp.]|uniref:class I SAM-dependent methyltransferase n=1 Tax=Tistlia sp. TaxID=3057121 RepID=UPI0034A3BB35
MQGSRHRWRRYYRQTAERPARDTLLAALSAWEATGRAPARALDLGCGAGRDTVELLRRGWRVLALDAEEAAVESLKRRPEAAAGDRLDCRVARIESLAPLPEAELVNASFVLFLLAPPDFAATWTAIRRALPPGGLFCGQLLGPEDDWAGNAGLTVQDAEGLAPLLAGYEVLDRREERSETTTPKGDRKRWHLHHLVLQRQAAPSDVAAASRP